MTEELSKIDRFITIYFSNTDEYRICLNKLEKLNAFLKEIKYSLKIDDIIFLLKNNIHFYNVVRIVFEKNKEQIVSDKIDKIFRRDLFINIMYAYCMINNIEIKEDCNIIDKGSFDGLDLYYNDIKDFKLLSYEEEQQLVRKAKAGDKEAKEEFVSHNLKLVVSIAKKYQNHNVPLADLISEGNLGLLKAIEKFDPDRGYRFSTYASWWIKQNVTRCISDIAREIRIPVYFIEKIRKYNRIETELAKELGRSPSIDEVSKKMGLSAEKIKKYKEIVNQPISLNCSVGEEDDREMVELIPDLNENVEEKALENVMSELIQKSINSVDGIFTPREQMVLYYRFPLDGKKGLTLEEIGKMCNVTRERIRQIEKRALKKLMKLKLFDQIDEKNDCSIETLINLNRLKKAYDNSVYLEYNGKSLCEILDCTKEKKSQVVSDLKEEERIILTKIFGIDLDGKYLVSIDDDLKYKTKFHRAILPKMKRLLSCMYKEENGKKTQKTMENLLSQGIKEKREEEQKIERNLAKSLIYTEAENSFLERIKSKMEYDDYVKLLALIDLIKMDSRYKKINLMGLVSLILQLGYINNVYYSNNEVSKILSLDCDAIRLLQKNVLIDYHDIPITLDENTGRTYSLKK